MNLDEKIKLIGKKFKHIMFHISEIDNTISMITDNGIYQAEDILEIIDNASKA